MPHHAVVSRAEWLEARRALLLREKEETHLRDAVNAERLALPWVEVDKAYRFDTPDGPKSLADLFDGRSQLITYHFMLGPGWEAGCTGCSFLSDHVDGALPHLNHHDVTWVAVSRAPLDEIEAYRRRMGWRFPWVSSGGTDFNRDYGVAFTKEEVADGGKKYNFGTTPPHGEENPGISFFFKDSQGTIYHTYSAFGRGLESILGTYAILDRAPMGRDEGGLPAPMAWVRHHDKYEPTSQGAASCCHHKNGQ
jgi:predicted dithiol-disulfide oxidoreductase (DUF899 family)